MCVIKSVTRLIFAICAITFTTHGVTVSLQVSNGQKTILYRSIRDPPTKTINIHNQVHTKNSMQFKLTLITMYFFAGKGHKAQAYCANMYSMKKVSAARCFAKS